MPDLFIFLTHEKNVFSFFFTFPIHFNVTLMTRSVNIFYIPSEQPNQAQFVCVCV